MKEVTQIKSETKPLEIDDTSSDTTVYCRYNIQEVVENDPVFNTEKTIYVYDETQYTFVEWYRMYMAKTDAQIEILKKCVNKLANELNITLEIEDF